MDDKKINEERKEIINSGENQPMEPRLGLTVGDGFNFGFGLGLALIVWGLILFVLGLVGFSTILASINNAFKSF